MRAAIAAACLALTLHTPAAGQAPLRVEALAVSAPTPLTTLETGGAQPARLAWSADASEIYVQTIAGSVADAAKGLSSVKRRHYVISASGGSVKNVQAEPEWAAEYWTMKSGKASPDGAPWEIDLKSEERLEKTTAVPRGGDLAKGGTTVESGSSSGDAATAAFNAQRVMTHNMLLKGETVGRFENTVIVPGLTYGWGPKGTRAVAFASQRGGRVVLMDDTGRKKEIAGTEDAVLPGWSPDGRKVAWLQKDGRRKFVLQVAAVGAGS